MKSIGRRHLLRTILQAMPKRVRFFYLRRAISVASQEPPPNLEIKIAETKEELEQAYQILHDSYVEHGFQKPDHTGMRIIKYFALPTTTTIIAKWNDKVIGTMSIIRMGPFGLPIESVFDIEKITAGGKVVAEASSLAIASEYRHRRGTLFLPLCKFFYLYIKNYMHLDRVVIAVNPSWADFYEGLLDFSLLDKKVISQYDFANGAPAVGFWSDLSTWEDRFKVLYNRRSKSQNLYHYFVELKHQCLHFPKRDYAKAMDPVMSPEMLNYFFRQKSRVFESLTDREIQALQACYTNNAYKLVLPKISEKNHRTMPRYTVHAIGESDPGKEVRVLEASAIGVKLQGKLPKRTVFDFIVRVSAERVANLKGMIMWIDQENNSYGVELIDYDDAWKEYIDYIKMDFENLETNVPLKKTS